MKEFRVSKDDADQRLDKYCARILKEAPISFFYKMFRKKNITLNGKKAKGNELLRENDVIRFFLSDETFDKFLKTGENQHAENLSDFSISVVYEDEHVLIVNKPAGILSQKAKEDSVSMNEYCLAYLQSKGLYDPKDPFAFQPSVCNRLDRNTSGLLLCSKSLQGARLLSKILKDRSVHKYYACIVKGTVREPFLLEGYLKKDEKSNKVQILEEPAEDADPVKTRVYPVISDGDLSLLKIELITGKTHQIRVHLSSIDHPILGDQKYGDRDLNQKYRCSSQLLHAYRLEMPELKEPFSDLSGKIIEIPLPNTFAKYINLEGLEHGDLEQQGSSRLNTGRPHQQDK
ncbi:MAG: RluA family pseudouridine synthase [Lachnospiraceae bacterium]|nr:RluA family pseudouridine synthase [Lachnospiraceae bacterium]